MEKNKSVAIIGAGPNGLIALYECLQLNLDVTVYEKDGNFGGVWNVHSEFSQSHKATVFNTTVLLESWDVDDCLANYYDKDYLDSCEFYGYLESFVRNNNLLKFIKFNCKIENIDKVEDGDFLLHTKSDIYRHNYVIVVTGRFGKEIIPKSLGFLNDRLLNRKPYFHTRYWDVYRDNGDINELMDHDELSILVIGGSHSSSEAIQDVISKYYQDDNRKRLKIYWQPTRYLKDKSVWLLDRYPYKGRKKCLPIDQSSCRLLSVFKVLLGIIIRSIAIPLHVPAGRYLYTPGYDHICVCKTEIVKPYLDNGTIEVLKEPIQLDAEGSGDVLSSSGVKFKKIVSGEVVTVDCLLLATGYEYAEPSVTIDPMKSEKVIRKLVAEGKLFHNIMPIQPDLNYRMGFLCTTKVFGSSLPTTQMEVRWLLYHWFLNPIDFFPKNVPNYAATLKDSTPVIDKNVFCHQNEIFDDLARDIPGSSPCPYISLFSLWPSTRKMAIAILIGPWVIHHYNWPGPPNSVARRRQFVLNSTKAVLKKSNSTLSFETICYIWGSFYMTGLALGLATLMKIGRNYYN